MTFLLKQCSQHKSLNICFFLQFLKESIKNYIMYAIYIILMVLDLNQIIVENINNLLLITSIITLAVIIFIEIRKDKKNKIALLNSLFDELYHNINLSDIFAFRPSSNFVRQLGFELMERYGYPENKPEIIIKEKIIEFKKLISMKNKMEINDFIDLDQKDVYPNPSDDPFLSPNSTKCKIFFEYFYPNFIKMKRETILMPYQLFAIENAMKSGAIWNLIGKRHAKNLGHLYYSLHRMNIHKQRFSDNKYPENWHKEYCQKLNLKRRCGFDQLIYEYWFWVHFRLWFLYIDLILCAPKKYLHNENVEEIKNFFEKNELKILNRRLSRLKRG